MEQIHPDDRERVLDLRRQLHAGGLERLSVEYRFPHPTRGERWIHHVARVARRDATGRTLRSFGVLRDITEAKQAEEALRDLSRRLIRAHEDERALLARELHDDVTQRLAVLAIDMGRAELAAPEGAQADVMRSVRAELVRLSEDIHSLAYQLHPSVLEELGLVEALRAECERRGRQGRLAVAMDLESLPAVVGKEAQLCLFRVAQEALTNVARHAGTQRRKRHAAPGRRWPAAGRQRRRRGLRSGEPARRSQPRPGEHARTSAPGERHARHRDRAGPRDDDRRLGASAWP